MDGGDATPSVDAARTEDAVLDNVSLRVQKSSPSGPGPVSVSAPVACNTECTAADDDNGDVAKPETAGAEKMQSARITDIVKR